MHKLADLVAEVGGSLNDIDGVIWQELLTDLYGFVSSGDEY